MLTRAYRASERMSRWPDSSLEHRRAGAEFGIIPPGIELPVAPMAGYLMADETTIVETSASAITVSVTEASRSPGDEARRLLADA
jgi:hypothetical protein